MTPQVGVHPVPFKIYLLHATIEKTDFACGTAKEKRHSVCRLPETSVISTHNGQISDIRNHYETDSLTIRFRSSNRSVMKTSRDRQLYHFKFIYLTVTVLIYVRIRIIIRSSGTSCGHRFPHYQLVSHQRYGNAPSTSVGPRYSVQPLRSTCRFNTLAAIYVRNLCIRVTTTYWSVRIVQRGL